MAKKRLTKEPEIDWSMWDAALPVPRIRAADVRPGPEWITSKEYAARKAIHADTARQSLNSRVRAGLAEKRVVKAGAIPYCFYRAIPVRDSRNANKKTAP
jgi:hypothetical protein